MNLNLRTLLALRAVITEGTVTAAGRRLHRTQPVVSRLIAQLESTVGFALFRRQGRRLLPTPEGLTFYRETERAFAAISEIESIAQDIAARRDAPLRIIAQSHFVHGLLHIALGKYCARNPAFRFSIEIRQREYISHWIANRVFDVGFTPQPVDHPQIKTEPLVRAPLFMMMPSVHRLAGNRQVSVADIAEEPLIAVRPGTPLRNRLEAFFAAKGAAPMIRGETASALSACQIVSKGAGVTLADPFVASLFVADPSVAIRPLSPRMDMEYLVLHPVGYSPGPVVQQFIGDVRETARDVIDGVMRSAFRQKPKKGKVTRAVRNP
ncbi:MAG: LysR family transcriptional regulator [Burkholderiales bacterium]